MSGELGWLFDCGSSGERAITLRARTVGDGIVLATGHQRTLHSSPTRVMLGQLLWTERRLGQEPCEGVVGSRK